MDEHIGKITSAATQKKYKGEGTTFAVRVEGDTKFTYYINREQDAHLRDTASKLVDTVAVITYEPSGDFRNIISIEPATEQEVAVQSEASETKEVHIIREACIKAAARIIAARISAGWEAECEATDTVKTAKIFEAYVYGQSKEPPRIQDEGGEVQQPDDEAPAEGIDMSHVTNKGDLFGRAHKYFKLTKTMTLNKLGLTDEMALGNMDEAWAQIVEVMKEG